MLAKKFDAGIVSLEHRYYGKSSPFNSLATENLKYLSSKQALFDLAAFRQYYQVSFVGFFYALEAASMIQWACIWDLFVDIGLFEC